MLRSIRGVHMRYLAVVRPLLLVTGGAVLGGAIVFFSSDTAAMRSDVAHLNDVVSTSQSHAMADVGYHFANLWFAAQERNWPLATFYYDETLSHIRWTIRIRPIRKDPDGNPVDLQGIYDGISNGVLDQLGAAIHAQDSAEFEKWYKTTLESCYSCHKSSGKPYLRPMIPQAPGQSIVNNDPHATWPQ